MVILPPPFVKTKYAGYFWNVNEQRLYSIKITGILKTLKLQKEIIYFFNGQKHHRPRGYNISVKGKRRFLSLEDLKKLRIPERPQVIPREEPKYDYQNNLYHTCK